MIGREFSSSGSNYDRDRKLILNNTGSEIVPPYAICEIFEVEDMGDGIVAYKIRKMTAAGLSRPEMWVFNDHSSIPELAPASPGFNYGSGTMGYPLQAIIPSSETPTTGDSVGPVEDEWHISTSGSGLTYMGSDPMLAFDEDDLVTCWLKVSPGAMKFFKLTEDINGGGNQTARAENSDSQGNSNGGSVDITSWAGLLSGAKAGYYGLFTSVGGEWVFAQGPCVVACPTAGSLVIGMPPEGTVGEAYSHTVTGAGLTTGPSISGLPPGLSATGGVISGTPTEEGEFFATVTGTAPRIPADTGSCTLTQSMRIIIAPEVP